MTKLNKARECDLEAMKKDNWLVLELLRGVSYTSLQKQLLRETDASLSPAANLSRLVLIAEQWQAAESTQEAFGSESTEYARQALADHERDRTEYAARKTSDYKAQIKDNWNKDHGSRQNNNNNNRQSNADECQGYGERGNRMHNRDICPTALLAKLASIVTRQAISYVYAGNHQGNVIASARWSESGR